MPQLQPSGQFSTTNYMVPSNGQTHAVTFQGQFSNVPALIDWRQFAIDNQLFQPQGVFIDNSAGTTPLVITILPINYKVVCGAGLTSQQQFPAPNGQTATITGDPANSATVIFVDFPVLPSGLSAAVTNTVNTNISGISPGVRIPVDANPMAAGNTLPYVVAGNVASGAADSNNPVKVGGVYHVAAPVLADGQRGDLQVDSSARLIIAPPTVTLNGAPGIPTAPPNATFNSNSSGNVANAAAVASLAGAIGQSTFCTGFEITAAGAIAAGVVVATLAGVLGGTQSYIFAVPAGVAVGATPLVVEFNPPLPSSAANTAITLTLPALGAGNTNACANIHGYTH